VSDRFLVEIGVLVIIFMILKKYWYVEKVRYYFGASVIGLNVFVCWLYLYLAIQNVMPWPLAWGKIFLHGLVAVIVWTFREVIKEKDE
tara:strand:+ start:36 stop:299 length:264 start_codon:yes stop_codon:yes gene_type:complete